MHSKRRNVKFGKVILSPLRTSVGHVGLSIQGQDGVSNSIIGLISGDCAPVTTCSPPFIPDGVASNDDGTYKSEYNPGERIRVACSQDYVISGQREATCQADFLWSWNEEPRCVPKRE
jgi:hypothetical protein